MWKQNFSKKTFRKSKNRAKTSDRIFLTVCSASLTLEIHPLDSRAMASLPASDKPHQLCYRNNRQREKKRAHDILLGCLVPALLQLPLREND